MTWNLSFVKKHLYTGSLEVYKRLSTHPHTYTFSTSTSTVVSFTHKYITSNKYRQTVCTAFTEYRELQTCHLHTNTVASVNRLQGVVFQEPFNNNDYKRSVLACSRELGLGITLLRGNCASATAKSMEKQILSLETVNFFKK